MVPHVAGLLLRDMLGMKVEYALDEENGPNGVNASRMYTMLASGEADLALTLWPAKFWNTSRADAVGALCPKSSTKQTGKVKKTVKTCCKECTCIFHKDE